MFSKITKKLCWATDVSFSMPCSYEELNDLATLTTPPDAKLGLEYNLNSHWDLQVVLGKDITYSLWYCPSKYFELNIAYSNQYIPKSITDKYSILPLGCLKNFPFGVSMTFNLDKMFRDKDRIKGNWMEKIIP